MSFTLAVVQPLAHRPPDDERNVADAVAHVETAAAAGADVVVLPETYPGPWRMPATFDPEEAMLDVAARCGVHVVYGTIEPIDDGERTAHNLICLATPAGERGLVYRRTFPPGPWIYTGGEAWDFRYVPGDEFPVAETEHGVLGFGMCSEVYVPEVSRALALRGAEVIVLPAGVDKQALWETWRTLIWARAIENLAVVVTTQNLFAPQERGLAMVAAPERVLLESTAPGVHLVEVDLERLRQLRAEDDQVGSSERNGAKAGVLRQWQRPELQQRIYAVREPEEASA